MDFRTLEEAHQTWQEIRVIGRTIERKGKKYHMVGMTLADEAKLYILEPYEESEHGRHRRKGIRNHRRILKEQETRMFAICTVATSIWERNGYRCKGARAAL